MTHESAIEPATPSRPMLEIAQDRSVSDESIVAGILAGDRALFEVLMRRYNTLLYRVALGILRDEHEAEDVMQDAYVRAFEHLNQFEGRARFSTWLTKIAVNEARARSGRRARQAQVARALQVEAERSEPVETPERILQNRESRRAVEQAIRDLAPKDRSVFMLRDVQGLDTAEAAECLGISRTAAKVRLFRARRRLKKRIMWEQAVIRASFDFHLSRCDALVARTLKALDELGVARGCVNL